MTTSQNSWQNELQTALDLLEKDPEGCKAALQKLLPRCNENTLCKALVLDGLGRVSFVLQQPAEGLHAFEKSCSILRENAADDATLSKMLIGALQNLAHALLSMGRIEKSLSYGQEAVRLAEQNFGPDSSMLAAALFHLSAAHYRKKDWDAAEALLRRAQQIWEKQQAPPEQLGTCLNNLGRIYEERGQTEQGIALHRQALALRRKLPNMEDMAFSLGNLGVALASAGQWQEAIDSLREALLFYGKIGKGQSPEAKSYQANLDICLRAVQKEGKK